MKKYVFGIIAVVLATASVAFTKPKEHRAFTVYYFPTDATGVLQPYIKSNNMAYTSPQLDCLGVGDPCEEANTNFSATAVSGGYRISPTGTDQPSTLSRRN